MNLLKVDSTQALQHLVTHTILIQKEKFTVSTITEDVMNHELFNNFCDRDKVTEMVSATIQTFLKYGALDAYDHGYRVIVNPT